MDAGKLEIVERGGGIEFTVKVVPGASRTKVAGLWGTALKLAVSAPPEGGKANGAVTKLLAEVLGVKAAQISIVSGQTQPVKRVAVAGLTSAAARVRLTKWN
jgi:hypothetical protein